MHRLVSPRLPTVLPTDTGLLTRPGVTRLYSFRTRVPFYDKHRFSCVRVVSCKEVQREVDV